MPISPYKFSLGLRVNANNGFHVNFSQYCGMILEEYPHENVTRPPMHVGTAMQIGAEEFEHYIRRTRPHVVTLAWDISDGIVGDAPINVPPVLLKLYTYQPSRGDWDYPKFVLKELPASAMQAAIDATDKYLDAKPSLKAKDADAEIYGRYCDETDSYGGEPERSQSDLEARHYQERDYDAFDDENF